MSRSVERWLWWVGVPFVIGVLTWVPYIVLNVMHHSTWSAWRIPFVPNVVFDTGYYLTWVGTALSRIPVGSHIGFFGPLFSFVGRFVPTSISVAEAWLVSLWVSATIGIWVLAPMVQEWSGCSRRMARGWSLVVWCSILLPFMPRPGVFTWYAPGYFIGLIGVWRMWVALETSRKYVVAIAWSVVALAASLVYPYYFLQIGVWLALLWYLHLHARNVRAARFVSAASIVGIVVGVAAITPVLIQRFGLALALQERAGLAFSRLPVLSNSLAVALCWTVFVAVCAWIYRANHEAVKRFYLLTTGWLALVAVWLSNVATGVYIHNDHFRAPAVLLSWVSLAVLLRIMSDDHQNGVHAFLSHAKRPVQIMRCLVGGMFVISLAMLTLYLFKKAFVFSGDFLNVVHVSHWLALCIASGALLGELGGWKSMRKTFIIGGVSAAVFLGIAARVDVFVRENRSYQQDAEHIPVVAWIRSHVPVADGICTDPQEAEAFGSLSAHLVFPTLASVLRPVSDSVIVDELRIIVGAIDADGDRARAQTVDLIDSMRGTTCFQYTQWAPLFRSFGITGSAFDRVTGCPRTMMKQNADAILAAPPDRQTEDAFRAICPVVIMKQGDVLHWKLPNGYMETNVDGRYAVWTLKSK